jgi:hypothetical protein
MPGSWMGTVCSQNFLGGIILAAWVVVNFIG